MYDRQEMLRRLDSMGKKTRTLKELREKIRAEVPYVDVKPYSHNIIGILLWEISAHYGDGHANKAIRDFGLEELGWSQVTRK